MKMAFGRIPSPPDDRDFELHRPMTYAASVVSDVRVSHVPEPIDQGEFGMCAAVTSAKILSAIEHKQRGVNIKLSPKYIYGNRTESMWQGEGMVPREVCKMLSRFGAPRWDMLPGLSNYPEAKASITSEIGGEGFPFRIKGFVRLKNTLDICDYMKMYDLPVFFGFSVYENIGASGDIPAPAGQMLGGHAVIGVELKAPSTLVIQNSWVGWGVNWEGRLDLDKHKGWEAWGLIPESDEEVINRPQEMLLTLGSKSFMVDGVFSQMDVAPFSKEGRTWVPLRFIVEALGAKVTFAPMADGKHMVLIQWGGEQETLT